LEAIRIYEEYGLHLSMLVKIILLIIDPEAIIFGGSIAKSFDLFEKSMYENLTDFPYPNSVDKIQILTSDLHEIGVLGAGALCIQ
jgi:glucokinase